MRLRVPSSKSVTQRALLIAALAPGESQIHHPLECEDSRHLRQALALLGAPVSVAAGVWTIRGGALHPPAGPLWCGDGGTTLRFLAPLALLLDGPLILDGSPRLRQRPHGDLVQALADLGVTARSPTDAALPLTLRRRDAPPVARAAVDVSRSSQFASALLLVAPRLPRGLRLELRGDPVSRPYLELTREVMALFGVTVALSPEGYLVPPGGYRPAAMTVEGDWSGAAFLLAAAWITGKELEVENLRPDSTQGDRAMVRFLEELARPHPHRFDLTDCPDLVAPLAAAAVFASHPVEIGNVAHARVKESDRLAVLAEGLTRAGARVHERSDALCLEPGGCLHPALLEPHGDHRMAMAFALLSLREPGITVVDHACVGKSYPAFWEDLERFR